ncbi:MAG: ribosomal-processing cysteine protease Prp [Faecalimonas sp.]
MRKHEYVGFRRKGHAGYDEAGRTLSVQRHSALIINTVNAIEQLYSR